MKLDDVPCETRNAYRFTRPPASRAPAAARAEEQLAALIEEIDLITSDPISDEDWLIW